MVRVKRDDIDAKGTLFVSQDQHYPFRIRVAEKSRSRRRWTATFVVETGKINSTFPPRRSPPRPGRSANKCDRSYCLVKILIALPARIVFIRFQQHDSDNFSSVLVERLHGNCLHFRGFLSLFLLTRKNV